MMHDNDKIDCAIAILSADIMRNKSEKFEAEYASLPAKKKRGAWMTAWFSLPKEILNGCGDAFYERFTQHQMGFAYWCEYTAWCLALYEMLIPDSGLYKPVKEK